VEKVRTGGKGDGRETKPPIHVFGYGAGTRTPNVNIHSLYKWQQENNFTRYCSNMQRWG